MDATFSKDNPDHGDRERHRDVLIDGHVHVHDCFPLTGFLDAAAANFSAASRTIGLAEPICQVLSLGDTHAQDTFSRFLRMAESDHSSSRWSFAQNGEQTAIAAVRDDDARILIISGQQVQTSDGLEVLALCCDEKLPGGLGTAETVAAAQNAGAIPVLPWGFGKWRGKRGIVIEELLRKEGAHRLALGDNSARLAYLGEPAQFTVARKLGVKVLAGTDPLPFRGQERRVGRYGSHYCGPFDENRASQSIRALLSDNLGPLVTYGRLETLLPFVVNQARMQLRKRVTARCAIT